jgi:hypothetical protein
MLALKSIRYAFVPLAGTKVLWNKAPAYSKVTQVASLGEQAVQKYQKAL